MIDIEKLKFSECKDKFDDNLEETKKFLSKKRELMRNKELQIKELQDLTKYENSLRDKKVIPINYERREFIINNYLLSNEYKNKKIFGVSFKKRKFFDINLNNIQLTNLFEFCGKKIENDLIFQIDKLDIAYFNEIKPEFGCHIVYKTINNKIFYFNIMNNKYYDLDNKKSDTFVDKCLMVKGTFYSIMFMNKNIKI